tara:strand:+ start:671 stop:1042 length:372 start_codon:yes stop_codon:yes gene_type:complete
MKYDFFMSPVHGIGCVATEDIKKGDIVAKEPYTITKVNYTEFKDYYWDLEGKHVLINGLGNYCNHDNNNNIYPILKITDEPFITFIAIRDINKGEELFNYYGKYWWSSRKINNQRKRFSLFRF